jgi:hypothetical protein
VDGDLLIVGITRPLGLFVDLKSSKD